MNNSFTPKTIGTSPAGVVWVARKAADVAKMTARLAALWDRHNAKKKAKARTHTFLRTKATRVVHLARGAVKIGDKQSWGFAICGADMDADGFLNRPAGRTCRRCLKAAQ